MENNIEKEGKSLEELYLQIGKHLFEDGHYSHAVPYLKLCSQLPLAQFMLFIIFLHHPTKQNRRKAFTWGLKASEELPIAQNCVGYCYEKGWGVDINLELAIQYYKQSSQNGCIEGYFNIGRYLDKLAANSNIFDINKCILTIFQTKLTPTLFSNVYLFEEFMSLDWVYEYANCSTSLGPKLLAWTKENAKNILSMQHHYAILKIYQSLQISLTSNSLSSSSDIATHSRKSRIMNQSFDSERKTYMSTFQTYLSTPVQENQPSLHNSGDSIQRRRTITIGKPVDLANLEAFSKVELQWESLELLLRCAIHGNSDSFEILKLLCKSDKFSNEFRGHISFCVGKLYQEHHFVTKVSYEFDTSVYKMKFLQTNKLEALLNSWKYSSMGEKVTFYSWVECLKGKEKNLQYSGRELSRLLTSKEDGAILYSKTNLFLFQYRTLLSSYKDMSKDWCKANEYYYYGYKLGHLECQLQYALLSINIVQHTQPQSKNLIIKCVKILEDLVSKNYAASNYELSRLYLTFMIDIRNLGTSLADSGNGDDFGFLPSEIYHDLQQKSLSILENRDIANVTQCFNEIEKYSSTVERNLSHNLSQEEVDDENDCKKMQKIKGVAYMKSSALLDYAPAQYELSILLEEENKQVNNQRNDPNRISSDNLHVSSSVVVTNKELAATRDKNKNYRLSQHRNLSLSEFQDINQDSGKSVFFDRTNPNNLKSRSSILLASTPDSKPRSNTFKKNPYEWCLMASNAGWPPAQYKLVKELKKQKIIDEAMTQKIKIWLKKSADKGYAPSVIAQRNLLITDPKFGVTFSQTLQKITKNLELVANEGCIEAQLLLVSMYLTASKSKPNQTQSKHPNGNAVSENITIVNNQNNNDRNGKENGDNQEESEKQSSKETNYYDYFDANEEGNNKQETTVPEINIFKRPTPVRKSFFNSRENYSKRSQEYNTIHVTNCISEKIVNELKAFNWSVRAAHLGSYDGLLNLIQIINSDSILISANLYTPYTYLQIYYIATSRRLEVMTNESDLNSLQSLDDLLKLMDKNNRDYQFLIICSIALAIIFEKHCLLPSRTFRAFHWWHNAWHIFTTTPEFSQIHSYLQNNNNNNHNNENVIKSKNIVILEDYDSEKGALDSSIKEPPAEQKSFLPKEKKITNEMGNYFLILLWKFSNNKIQTFYKNFFNTVNTKPDSNEEPMETNNQFNIHDDYNIKSLLQIFAVEYGLSVSQSINIKDIYPIIYSAVLVDDHKAIRSYIDKIKLEEMNIDDISAALKYASARDHREIRLMLSRILKENSLELKFKEFLDKKSENNQKEDDLCEYQEVFVLLNQLEEISSKDYLVEEKKNIARHLEELGAMKAANVAKDLKPILRSSLHPELLLNHQPTLARKLFTKYVGSKYFSFSGLIKSINQLIKMQVEFIQKYTQKNKPKYQPIIQSMIQLLSIYERKKEAILSSNNNPEQQKDLFKLPTMIYIAGVGIRMLDNKAAECLLPEEGELVGHEEYGSHIIRIHNGIHFKGDPHAPGVEFMVDSLNKIIARQGSTPIELIKVYRYIHPCFDPNTPPNLNLLNINEAALQKQELIYLASKTVRGANLQFILDQHPEYIFSDDILDPLNFSAVFISSLLTNPHDGKPENYMVQLRVDNNKEVKKIFLIGIDNDIAFADPIIIIDKGPRKGLHQTGIKNILYFFPQMKESVDQEFIKLFLKSTPESIILTWISSILEKNEHYQQLYDEGVFSEEDFENLHIPITFVKGTVSNIYRKLCIIQKLFIENPNITHIELFYYIEPLLYYYYEGIKLKTRVSSSTASFKVSNYFALQSSQMLQCIGELYAGKPPTVEEIFSLLRHHQSIKTKKPLAVSLIEIDGVKIDFSDEEEFKKMVSRLSETNSTLYNFEENRNTKVIDEFESFLAEIDYQRIDLNYLRVLISCILTFKISRWTIRNSPCLDYALLSSTIMKMESLRELTLISCYLIDDNTSKLICSQFPNISCNISN